MALVAPAAAEVTLLEYILGKDATGAGLGQKLHLYSNNHTPGDASVLGSFSEVISAGYTEKTLTSSLWNITDITGGGSTGIYTEQTFSIVATAAVAYGYYVTDLSETKLLWAEMFTGAPFSLPNGGGTIAITLKVTLD